MEDDKWILEGRKVKRVDLMTWARWFETARDERIVKQETIGDHWISTVFLGLDHQYGDGPPLIFETMAFKRGPETEGVGEEVLTERTSTYDEAEAAHERACQHVRNLLQ